MFWLSLKIKELETINYELTRKIQNLEKETQDSTASPDHQEMMSLRKENTYQDKTITDLRLF